MRKERLLLPIILAVIGLAGTVVITLLAPGSFIIHPVFEIETEDFKFSSDNKTKTQIIEITNTGWVQAKNVLINIDSTSPIEISKLNCNERIIVEIKNKFEVELELERLSVNLPCDIWIKIPPNELLVSNIVITASDSPAYLWTLDKRTTETASDEVDRYVIMFIVPVIFGLVVGTLVELARRPSSKKEIHDT